ncbi:putative lipoprotein [Leadbettera azotonutricia ZAS-9]|uniref:Putative lipoprotein n=2 Tax=Leadbettera azotonutricia TaxID=150829 RepID=F5Y6L7_LEAAZ|nr:putative lipoprotein [Leadbettera azotonutricia ZAS-9]
MYIMKKYILSALIFAVLLFAACSSIPKVTRVEAASVIDLSGRWNDTDVRMVSTDLINECLNSPRVAQYIQEYISQNNGRLPACLVGSFKNDSSEHIDTSIISKNMEIAIVNSGRLDFVAGGDTREEIRAERQDQQANSSEETASALAYETGASLMLTGSVKAIIDKAGNKTVRSYFVSAELTNITTNRRLWMGENSEIKKEIKQSNYRP